VLGNFGSKLVSLQNSDFRVVDVYKMFFFLEKNLGLEDGVQSKV
jgi:hypothetical protein